MYKIKNMEKNFCNKCGKCCEKIAVDFNTNVMYRDGIQVLSPTFSSMLIPVSRTKNITFCSCKFLINNLCTNPEKPKECSDYPNSPFAFLPEGCGYEGYIFMQNERVKQKVRKLKEEILDYSTKLSTEKELKKIIDHHQAFIDKYKQYGSYDW